MPVLSNVLRRSQRLQLCACNAVYGKLETPLERRNSVLELPSVYSGKSQKFENYYQFSLDFSRSRQRFSSKADAKRVGEEDDNEDELLSEEEHLGNEDEAVGAEDERDLPGPEIGTKGTSKKRSSELFRAIISASGLSVGSALDKWLEEGKEMSRSEIADAMLYLRRHRMYGRALQMSEWLEANKLYEFTERDYASRLDLIAKSRGLQKAEAYIDRIPKSLRGEVTYRSLLANTVVTGDVKKVEEVFDKMKNLGFPLTSFSCDQLLLIYKKRDKKKMADVLLLMEKENVKPSRLTYKTLIDTKGSLKDITGMEQIMEKMKAEGVEPDIPTLSTLARQYVFAGLEEKAEKVLKEIEGESLEANRWVCKDLLSLYSSLGRAEEVNRIWNICKDEPRFEESIAAVLAFGKLNQIEKAEEVFEKTLKMSSKVSSLVYSALLRVYVDHKMLSKGKDLVKRMVEHGCTMRALTWDSLIRLYVESGEVEEADTLLSKAADRKNIKPLIHSFMCIMGEYAKQGDVHNTERMFKRMREAGYMPSLRHFDILVEAYANANIRLYGIRDRMKAYNLFPNREMAVVLSRVDPFKKNAVSDLLD